MYVHYSIFSENTVNNALIFYILAEHLNRIEQENLSEPIPIELLFMQLLSDEQQSVRLLVERLVDAKK